MASTIIFNKSTKDNGFQKSGSKPPSGGAGGGGKPPSQYAQGGNKGGKPTGGKSQGKGNQGGGGGKEKKPQNQGNVNNTTDQRDKIPKNIEIRMQAGIVRSVNSGDSLTILEVDDSPARTGPKEILFTILGLKAPIVGRREADGTIIKDERFAWQSREFLRKLIIGQPVIYRIEHHVDERNYGELWSYDERDIRLAIVMNGWAEVLTKPKKNSAGFEIDPSLSQIQLENARNEAKANERGIWSKKDKDAIRKVTYHDVYRDENQNLSNDDLYNLYKTIKDKGSLKAVVENVRNGTTYNLLLTDTFDYFTITLSGVRSPALKPEQQPFAREAKYLAEHLLLNRDVTVTIDGLDKLSLTGSVLLDGSNIALTLLNLGLASFVEWTCKENASMSEKFKEAEKKSQEQLLRIWSDYQPPIAAPSGKNSKQQPKNQSSAKETSITGKVIEIINAGSITVRVTKPDANNVPKTVDRIIIFSSIRLPRGPLPAKAKKEEKKDLTEEQKKIEEENLKRENIYAAEAKEFLRNLLIGQKVRCVFDYPRASRTADEKTPTGPVKHYWSVYLAKGQTEKNVAIELVNQGYAWVVDHATDELRSADYKDLILAEKAAKSAGKGLHSPPNKLPRNYMNDLTMPATTGDKDKDDKALKGLLDKCRHFLVGFTAKDKIEGIVDYVFTGSRFKLTLPNQHCTVMFALTGVIIDKPIKEDVPAKPEFGVFDKQYPVYNSKTQQPAFGNIALHYARDTVFQRKIDISVKKLDSYGGFIGQLFVDGKDLGRQLIEKGYAKIHAPSLRKFPFYNDYKMAEDTAKDRKIGLWEFFDFEEEKRNQAQELENKSNRQKDRKSYPIAVTDVRSGSEFSFQQLGNDGDTSSLESLSANLQSEKLAPHPNPKVHDIVAAQFSVDDLWYRAEIIGGTPKGAKEQTFEVRYMDYGNRETLSVNRIRQLPEEYMSLLDPQAKDARLFYIRSPPLDSEFGRDSMTALREALWDRVLYAEEMRTDKLPAPKNSDKAPQFLYHLIVIEDKKDLNKTLIRNGNAKVEKMSQKLQEKLQDPYYASLLELQKEAHKSRLGIWQYGDDPEDDEPERL